jgi:hypothetical protein
MGFIGTMGKLLGPLMMLEALTQPSDEDIAKLRARDARNAQDKRQSEVPLTMLERMMQPGVRRGQSLDGPRSLGTPDTAQAALQQSMRANEVKGEIVVRVSAAPGLNVQTEINSNTLLPLRASQGKTNQAAGF